MIKTVNQLREEFTNYFIGKGHKLYPSAPLIPEEDDTLLFTTAGMVQFKDNYASNSPLEIKTATTVQKCLRTTDLDIVGTTKRHCTFFEMLGNFSFGGYFKKETIEMAWDFSLNHLKFDPDKSEQSVIICRILEIDQLCRTNDHFLIFVVEFTC